MTYYCPHIITAQILSNHSDPNAAADDDGSTANNNNNNNNVLVPFPSLPPSQQHPTDSSQGNNDSSASSSSSMSMEGDADDEDDLSSSSCCSSSLEEGDDVPTAKSNNKSTAAANGDEKGLSKECSSSTFSKEHTTTAMNIKHGQKSDNNNKLLPTIPSLIGLSDPMSTMKTYLNELVAVMKREKAHDEKMMNKTTLNYSAGCGVKRRRLENKDSSNNVDGTKEEDDDDGSNNVDGSSKSKEENSVSYQDEKLAKEPIDTIMHWMDSFQDDESIQVSISQ